MKIKELINRLAEFPEDYDVIIASDPEGNSFDYLSDVHSYVARKDGRDISIINAEDVDENESENCVVIWP